MALLRPSELARLWKLHPQTVNGWIRDGRLPSIKTPGSQYRVRASDARAYCEQNGLAMPREVAAPAGRVAIIGKPSPGQRSIAKACKGRGTAVFVWSSALEGLLAIASDVPDVVAIDGSCTEVKITDALRALRRTPATAEVPVVIYDAASKAVVQKVSSASTSPREPSEDAASAVVEHLERR